MEAMPVAQALLYSSNRMSRKSGRGAKMHRSSAAFQVFPYAFDPGAQHGLMPGFDYYDMSAAASGLEL